MPSEVSQPGAPPGGAAQAVEARRGTSAPGDGPAAASAASTAAASAAAPGDSAKDDAAAAAATAAAAAAATGSDLTCNGLAYAAVDLAIIRLVETVAGARKTTCGAVTLADITAALRNSSGSRSRSSSSSSSSTSHGPDQEQDAASGATSGTSGGGQEDHGLAGVPARVVDFRFRLIAWFNAELLHCLPMINLDEAWEEAAPPPSAAAAVAAVGSGSSVGGSGGRGHSSRISSDGGRYRSGGGGVGGGAGGGASAGASARAGQQQVQQLSWFARLRALGHLVWGENKRSYLRTILKLSSDLGVAGESEGGASDGGGLFGDDGGYPAQVLLSINRTPGMGDDPRLSLFKQAFDQLRHKGPDFWRAASGDGDRRPFRVDDSTGGGGPGLFYSVINEIVGSELMGGAVPLFCRLHHGGMFPSPRFQVSQQQQNKKEGGEGGVLCCVGRGCRDLFSKKKSSGFLQIDVLCRG